MSRADRVFSFWGSTAGACRIEEEWCVTVTTRFEDTITDILRGNVFEKRLIESYIAENGRDPVTGEELSAEDLVNLKSARVAKPRPPTLTSIPSLLSVFQNEWDALALETYRLNQDISQLRQELSTALYHGDASGRVITRLTQERDEARDALAKVSVGQQRSAPASTAPSSVAAPSNGDAMPVEGAALPVAMQKKVEELHER